MVFRMRPSIFFWTCQHDPIPTSKSTILGRNQYINTHPRDTQPAQVANLNQNTNQRHGAPHHKCFSRISHQLRWPRHRVRVPAIGPLTQRHRSESRCPLIAQRHLLLVTFEPPWPPRTSTLAPKLGLTNTHAPNEQHQHAKHPRLFRPLSPRQAEYFPIGSSRIRCAQSVHLPKRAARVGTTSV